MPDPRPTLEQRLVHDEARLARDEALIEAEAAEIQESRIVSWMSIALTVVLGIAVAALVISVVALKRDVGLLSQTAPASSVGTSALQNGSVSADKLAGGAVTRGALAAGAVGSAQLAPGAVDSRHVAANALTGADIRERSLSAVPTARDAVALGGLRASAYLSQPFAVSSATATDERRTKGPVSARCPAGSRVLSGGAAIEGTTRHAALVSNTPEGEDGWSATGHVAADLPWRLVVTAICAAGGH